MGKNSQNNKQKQSLVRVLGALKRVKRGGKRRPKIGRRNRVSGGLGPLGLQGGITNTTNRRSQIVSEDEYIADILGSVAFANTVYPINPAQLSTFPWGYKIAALYEEYEFIYLEFYYKRIVSEFATNGQAGKVIFSVDYDATDDPPNSKQQVEDTDPHVDFMPCTQEAVLRVDCARMKKNDSKYCRPGAQEPNTDLKTYDGGNLNVSTVGCTNTSAIGELHVRYAYKVFKPVLEPTNLAAGLLAQHLEGTTPTTANHFATMVQTATSTTIFTVPATTNVLTCVIPGTYLIFLKMGGTTITAGGDVSTTGVPLVTYGFGTTGAWNAGSGTVLQTTTFWGTFDVGETLTYVDTIVGGSSSELSISSFPQNVLFQNESRIERLERLVRELSLKNDDWGCGGLNSRRPEIPPRTCEVDEKSQISNSSLTKRDRAWFTGGK